MIDQLQSLVAVAKGTRTSVRFRVVAKIEVMSAIDRWATAIFAGTSRPELAADFLFPVPESR